MMKRIGKIKDKKEEVRGAGYQGIRLPENHIAKRYA